MPANNLATGLTVVLAGAYAAYHNQPFPDAWVKPLYQQMEGLLLQDSRLHQRSTVGKAADYQVMVGAGMAMMLTQAELQKAPDAKALQQLRDTGADAHPVQGRSATGRIHAQRFAGALKRGWACARACRSCARRGSCCQASQSARCSLNCAACPPLYGARPVAEKPSTRRQCAAERLAGSQ